MTRSLFILPILAGLIVSCSTSDQAEREWKEQLYQNLAVVGARNWIVIAESSFPAYTGPGIRTLVSEKKSDEVLIDVLNMLEEEAHVVPRIMLCSELKSVSEDYAPGMKRYRNNVHKILPGRQHFELMSNTLNSLIEDASKQFNVLVIKSRTALPYSNIYIELDSGYWNSESEAVLRNHLHNQEMKLQSLKPKIDSLPTVPLDSVTPQAPKQETQKEQHISPQPQSPPSNLPILPKEKSNSTTDQSGIV